MGLIRFFFFAGTGAISQTFWRSRWGWSNFLQESVGLVTLSSGAGVRFVMNSTGTRGLGHTVEACGISQTFCRNR